MNFLAHYEIATRFLAPMSPFPAYVLGTALPDLLPLAADRVRLRPGQLAEGTEFGAALGAGISAHLAADAAFHKTAAFAKVQAEVSGLLTGAGFEGVRVRHFFVAHVLTELVLDAVLLRADPALADRFYDAFTVADFDLATRRTEEITGRALPNLPFVLARFAEVQYLRHYTEDNGVATGLSNLCRRASQDTFVDENFSRLVGVVKQAAERMPKFVPALFGETVAGIVHRDGELGFYLNAAR